LSTFQHQWPEGKAATAATATAPAVEEEKTAEMKRADMKSEGK